MAKEPCKRDYILQNRPIILRSLLIVATPYQFKILVIKKTTEGYKGSFAKETYKRDAILKDITVWGGFG